MRNKERARENDRKTRQGGAGRERNNDREMMIDRQRQT